MKSSAAKIQMTSYEELFQTGDNADSSAEKAQEIPLSDLYPFKNHPFPVLVRDLDEDEATIIMADSNIQRENLIPSEKAWAYKMKLDAIQREAGRPTKNNSRQAGENYSVDILSENSNDSAWNIHRFIRLTELLPELLQMVDEKSCLFIPPWSCPISHGRNKKYC